MFQEETNLNNDGIKEGMNIFIIQINLCLMYIRIIYSDLTL